jgi:hypothetical protein
MIYFEYHFQSQDTLCLQAGKCVSMEESFPSHEYFIQNNLVMSGYGGHAVPFYVLTYYDADLL